MTQPARRPVVFDLDGVLIDSEALSWESWRRVLLRYDLDLNDEDIATLTGRTEHDTHEYFAARAELPDFATFSEELSGVTLALFDERLEAYEDAVDALDYLLGRGFPVALASSSTRSRVDRSLATVGLNDRFGVVVGGDEVVKGKPDPDLFLAAASGLGVDPTTCLAVEDAPAGIAAAKAAGMRVVAVERGLFRREELDRADVIVPRLTPAVFLIE